MCVQNTEKHVSSIPVYILLAKLEVQYAHYLETCHFFWSAHTYPLQPEAILVCWGALPNLERRKIKLESNTFYWQLIAPILSDLVNSGVGHTRWGQ
jgi:hypothetical protein